MANIPASIWRSTDGLSEFTNAGSYYIVDTVGAYLVDPSGDFIVDTGVINNRIPGTVWGDYGEVTGDGYPVVYMAAYS